MITSASGWRKVFAVSGNEQDTTDRIGRENRAIAALAAQAFAQWLTKTAGGKCMTVIAGTDTRPTGPEIADAVIKSLSAMNVSVKYAGIISAPEIMAASHSFDAFVYISASHNPIGHNGIKFGLNNGGVLDGKDNADIVSIFEEKCSSPDAELNAERLISGCAPETADWIYAEQNSVKMNTLSLYTDFAKTVISGTDDTLQQRDFFTSIRKNAVSAGIEIVCDMNGSARTKSIDREFFNECGFSLHAINDTPGKIAHAIIPEPENLIWCAEEMKKMHANGHNTAILGYMPDCDGDRGNIVWWNEKTGTAEVLKAQEVFALSVLSETAFMIHQQNKGCTAKHGLINKAEDYLTGLNTFKPAVVVNGPTSMRIEEIASAFNAEVFRAEVGEANVVNLAREKRAQGYTVRILGEGSNGGNITHPAAVRDPLNTIFALIKLLTIKDEYKSGVMQKKGLFHLWCEASGQDEKYTDNFSLGDIIRTLPVYTTTGVSEKRAVLHIMTEDHGILKGKFQKIFERQWTLKQDKLRNLFGIYSYEAVATNGTKETKNITDYSTGKKGGLKIIFKGIDGSPLAFIWMRGSGTEPVFRVMCDVKGSSSKEEKTLLEWETQMLYKADRI